MVAILSRSLRLVLFVALGAWPACKSVEEVATLLPHVVATPSDEALVFPCYYRGKTGLYQVQLATGAVRELVPPEPGLLQDPCLSPDGNAVWYCFSRPTATGYAHGVAALPLDGSPGRTLFATPFPVAGLAVAPRANTLYFVMARDFGRASPVAGAHLRAMEVYSAAPNGSRFQQETHWGTFAIRGRVGVDAREEELYLNLIFSNKTHPDGPYRYHLRTRELTSLAVGNLRPFYRKPFRSQLPEYAQAEFLVPVPKRTGNGYYLVGSYKVFAVDAGTRAGQLVYQQPEKDDLAYHLTIGGLSPLNHSNRVVLHKQERHGSSYVLVDTTGTHSPIALDLTPFLPHFLPRSTPEAGRK
jgi:hypothetical protein